MNQVQDGVVYHPILNIPDTQCGESDETLERNVAKRLNSSFPRLHMLPGYGKYKGPGPLALVAGGPSLNKTLGQLSEIGTKMVCGSAHDHAVSMGVIPDYTVICDPDVRTVEYLKNPVPSCKYLIASSCHDNIFERLKGFAVTIWNNAGIDPKNFRGEPMIQGGCTVTLRAMNIAIVLGYLNLHFFGFDSSYEDEFHSYATAPDDSAEIQVQVGGKRIFKTTSTWLIQALHFQEQLRNTGWMFTPTVHGDGLIAEIMKQAKEMSHGLQPAVLRA